MFGVSWLYLYGVGGLAYVAGTVICVRSGSLDLRAPRERQMFIATSAALVLFAVVHALFQFVFPFVG